MGRAIIDAGICGFRTEVRVIPQDGMMVQIAIESQCPNMTQLARELDGRTWNGLSEVIRPNGNEANLTPLQSLFQQCIPHPSCPVYSGILKAVEVTLGLALPAEARIQVLRD
ncbi:MAG: hypothetical protein J7M34_09120 [Anaerolineae bacterium]|nr:hypothetical protein [Anaerolineae bacterium]